MGDVFKEQIVKRKPNSKDSLKRAGIIAAVVLVFFVSMAIVGQFALPITLVAGFGAAYLMSFLRVEYEYIFTNGEIDIDIIYNRSRRKRVFSSHVNKFEVMAHVEDTVHVGEFHRAQETKDYSSGEITPNSYMFLVSYNSKYLKVIFEPNEVLLKAISSAIPRSRLHLKK